MVAMSSMPEQMHQGAQEQQQIYPSTDKVFPVFTNDEENQDHGQHGHHD